MTELLVLLDIDGTLVNANGAGRAAMKRALQALYGTYGGIDTHRFGGRCDRDTVFSLMRQAGIADVEIENRFMEIGPAMAAALDEMVTRTEKRIKALPGGLDFVAALVNHPRVTLGLVTGNFPESASAKLSHAGYDTACFQVGAFGSEAVDRSDLPPLAIQRAYQLTGRNYRGEQVVIVGDTVSDVACGLAVGARVLAVTTGADDHTALNAAGAHRIFTGLSTDILNAILE